MRQIGTSEDAWTSEIKHPFCSQLTKKRVSRLLLNMTSEAVSNKGSPSGLTIAFSILTHVLVVAPVIYILKLAFTTYSLFSWHPVCMSVGVSRRPRLKQPQNVRFFLIKKKDIFTLF